jgi:hypothetical protein
MATNIFKINKILHFIENLASNFEKALVLPVVLVVALLKLPLSGECLQQGSDGMGIDLALEGMRDDHC